MTDWMLIITMLSGEAATLNLPQARCLQIPAALAAGGTLTLTSPQGKPYQVSSAVCVPVARPVERKVPVS